MNYLVMGLSVLVFSLALQKEAHKYLSRPLSQPVATITTVDSRPAAIIEFEKEIGAPIEYEEASREDFIKYGAKLYIRDRRSLGFGEISGDSIGEAIDEARIYLKRRQERAQMWDDDHRYVVHHNSFSSSEFKDHAR
jgi:hypothetical protein